MPYKPQGISVVTFSPPPIASRKELLEVDQSMLVVDIINHRHKEAFPNPKQFREHPDWCFESDIASKEDMKAVPFFQYPASCIWLLFHKKLVT